MTETCLISIILPVYNGEKYLEQALQSCLNQTYKNFELIIVDDASTDNSLSIVKKFENDDNRIKVLLNETNLSLPGSLNVGHKHAIGEFVTWTSDDNILKPNFLSSLYKSIISQNCDVVFSDYDIIWADGSLKREHITGPLTKLIFGDIIGASFLYKMNVFNELEGYNRNLFLIEDYDFFLRASLKFKFHHLEENLYQYRIHEKSLTGKIARNKDYTARHEKALKMMFVDISSKINLCDKTIKLILDLYFNKPISLKVYAENSKTIKYDICLYQNALKTKEKKSSIFFLEEAIRNSWFLNNKEQTASNLLWILLKQRSLLGYCFNRNATIRLIINCLKF
jgi:glycosyltransferase involved in cell wall biosynthesis